MSRGSTYPYYSHQRPPGTTARLLPHHHTLNSPKNPHGTCARVNKPPSSKPSTVSDCAFPQLLKPPPQEFFKTWAVTHHQKLRNRIIEVLACSQLHTKPTHQESSPPGEGGINPTDACARVGKLIAFTSFTRCHSPQLSPFWRASIRGSNTRPVTGWRQILQN